MVFHIYIYCTVLPILRSLCSYFINKNITKALLSISYGLEAVGQQADYSFIQPFQLLKQFLRPQGHLFQEKESRYLELSTQLKLFPQSCDSSSYRGFTVELFLRIRSLSLKGRVMFTSLIDYYSTAFSFQ